MTPLSSHSRYNPTFAETRRNACERQIGERLAKACEHAGTPQRLLRASHDKAAATAEPPATSVRPSLPFGSHSRLPATLTTHANTQPFFNSHRPPRLPPKKCGARMALPRVLQHALDGASLGSISAPPQHAHRCPDPVRDHPISPLHMPPAAAKRIHTARARATPGTRPERQAG